MHKKRQTLDPLLYVRLRNDGIYASDNIVRPKKLLRAGRGSTAAIAKWDPLPSELIYNISKERHGLDELNK